MYLVVNPFRSKGVYYTVGSLIDDPTAILCFRNKLKEGHIVDVSKPDRALVQRLRVLGGRREVDLVSIVKNLHTNKKEDKDTAEKVGDCL